MMDWHYGAGWMGGGLFMLVFWVLVLVGIVALVRWLATTNRGSVNQASVTGSGNNALSILRERYARGEIEREEFEQKRRDLETR